MSIIYKINITNSAQNDIIEIYDYIKFDKIIAAKNWRDKIKENIKSLLKNPFRSPIIPEAEKLKVDYRHIILGNYRIIYKISGKIITILRVIHGARLLNTDFHCNN